MFVSSATKRKRRKEKAAALLAAQETKEVVVTYTSVPGQKVTKAMTKMKETVQETATYNNAFDLQLAQRWLAAEKKLGNWHYQKKAKKRRKRGVKKKKAVNYEENAKFKHAAEKATQEKILMRKQALLERLEVRANLVSVTHESVCRWTYYDRLDRVDYRCTNARENHPLTSEQSNYCFYHMIYCLNDHSAMHGKVLRPLEVQNKLALCQICYKQAARGQPRPLLDYQAPGVAKIDRTMNARLALITDSAVPKPHEEMKAQGIGLNGEDIVDTAAKKEFVSVVIKKDDDGRPICRWSREHPDTKERWRCHCKVIKHITTRNMLTECGWHQTHCIGFHQSKNPSLEIPNELGLCPAHYSAKTGKAPKNYGEHWWDLPVVNAPPKKVKIIPRRNKLAPAGLPPGFKFGGDKRSTTIDPPSISRVEDRPLTLREKIIEKIKNTHTAKQYTQTKKAVRFKINRFQKGRQAALSIQRIFRGFRRRDDIEMIRDHSRYLKRRKAVVQLQSWVRFMQGSLMAHKWLEERRLAAGHVNRVVRGMLARRYTVRLIASRLLQRVGRGFLGRCKSGAQRTVRLLNNKYLDRQWAVEKIVHVVRGWIRKRHDPGPMARDASRDEPSALNIQRLWRGMLGRRKARVQKEWIRKYHFVIGWVQRHWRGKAERQKFGEVFVPLRAACLLVQRIWRGYCGRCIAWDEKQLVEEGWDWLNPALPRDVLLRFMPRFTYGKGTATVAPKRPFTHPLQKNKNRDTVEYLQQCIDDNSTQNKYKTKGDNYKVLTRTQQKEEALKRIAAKKRWPRRPFANFDIDHVGSISRREFRKALKMCGHYLSVDQIWTLMNRFDLAQNGLVDYVSFLEYVRAQDRPCTKHRIWGCADCVMYKACIKDTCSCHRYHAPMQTGNGTFMKSMVCECGHYMTQHMLVPKDRLDKDFVEGEGYSAKQLKAMLTFEAPHFIPEKIYGTELDEMELSMGYTRIDLKATLNCVDDRIVTRIVPEPFEADSKYDSRAMFRYQRLYADIIASIIETSQSTVNDLNGSLGWNQTTNPRVSNTGEIVKNSWKFHPLGNSVGPPQLSDGALQNLKKLAKLENDKKAAIVADPRSDANKIRARLAEAKLENSLLMPFVAANNTDIETYETKHTITRPLPLISHGELRLTIDVVDIYIDVLLTLIDPQAGVMEDDQQLTLYVYNLFTFFDRHWKHLISDLRMGTLNPELPVEKTTRAFIELHLVPSPSRARHLDHFLRTVGFHRRASNARFKQDHLKLDDDDDGDNSKDAEAHEEAEWEDVREIRSDDGSGMSLSIVKNIVKKTRNKTASNTNTNGRLSLTPRSERGRPSTTVPAKRNDSNAVTDIVLPSIDQASSEDGNAMFEDALERPRSADDVRLSKVKGMGARLRTQPIFESFHDMASAPQKKDIKIHRVRTRTTKPFVCDHPGCGAAFTDPRNAALHQKDVHAHAPRIVSKAKRADQLLRPFWPKQVPWLHTWSPSARRKAKATVDHGKRYVSALSGKRFLLHKEARAEIQYFKRFQLKHEYPEPDNRFTVIGATMHVPPGAAPARSQIHICKKHWPNKKVPSKCLRCKATKAMVQPKLPCMFFNKMRVQIPVIDEDGEASTDEIVFSTEGEATMLPLVRTELSATTPIEIAALARDCTNQYWISYSRYWEYKSLARAEYKTKSNFMKKHELLKETESQWAKLNDIVGTCFIIECTRSEFKDRKKRKMLPKTGQVYFHRDSFSSKFYESRMLRKEKKERMEVEAAANIARVEAGGGVVQVGS